jgi:hypothetical protein
MIIGKWKACEFGFSDGVLVFVIAWTLAMKKCESGLGHCLRLTSCTVYSCAGIVASNAPQQSTPKHLQYRLDERQGGKAHMWLKDMHPQGCGYAIRPSPMGT